MIRRREFLAGLAGAAASPLVANAQQMAEPVVGVIGLGTDPGATSEAFLAAFRKGLSQTGYVEGQNVTVEYHRLEDQSDRLPALMADLVRRRIAVIVTGSTPTSLAAKNATASIPIVFASGQDPVQLGLVASPERPGGNATGINFFNGEVAAKRLALLHQLVPTAVRVVVLLNPANAAITATILRDVQAAAGVMGLQIQTLSAATISEIDAALATIVRERPDALLVAGDPFFGSRYEELATLAVRE
jgi:putative tryptophan/tyrosine transport system substrate-binding protein